MPTKQQRASEKKFVRTPGGKTVIRYFKGKSQKHHCAICKGILHGTPHSKNITAVSKLSKSKKRPSVAFGGVLCSNCRTIVFEETIKVKGQIKGIEEVPFKVKSFVEMAMQKVEVE